MTTSTITYHPGKVAWRELMTHDVAGAKAFYGGLLGWTFKDVPMGEGFTYVLIHAGETQIAGIADRTALPNAEQIPSHWLEYVSVPDVDAAAVRADKAGGKLLMPPTDIPNVGRFCVIQDPQGGVLAPFKSLAGDTPDGEFPKGGEFCWEQLNTPEPDAAVAFYGEVIGWKPGKMSTGGDMVIFEREGDCQVASVFPSPAGVPAHWLTYVLIADLKASNAQVKALGGQVHMEEIPVPGIGTFSVCQDPQGAYVCLFQAEMA